MVALCAPLLGALPIHGGPRIGLAWIRETRRNLYGTVKRKRCGTVKLIVAIPAYNEEANTARVIAETPCATDEKPS